MSFFDSAKEKLQELAGDHPDQVEQLSDQAIERGGDAVGEPCSSEHATGTPDRWGGVLGRSASVVPFG